MRKFFSVIMMFSMMIIFNSLSCIEVMNFNIESLGITVAKATIVDAKSDSSGILTVRAKSTSFAKAIWKLDNYYSSEYQKNYLPKRYIKIIKQNKYNEDRIVNYDRSNRIAIRTSKINANMNQEYKIKNTSRDFFSALFYFRYTEKDTGIIWLDANKLIWKAEYQFIEEETIDTDIQDDTKTRKYAIRFQKAVDTKKERSDMLTNNLVNENIDLFFWITDDKKRIPVRAKFDKSPIPVYWEIESYVKR